MLATLSYSPERGTHLSAVNQRTFYGRAVDDDRGVHTVIAVLPPAVGLGHAIRDRLTKAAEPVR